jgi:hypothetical protein
MNQLHNANKLDKKINREEDMWTSSSQHGSKFSSKLLHQTRTTRSEIIWNGPMCTSRRLRYLQNTSSKVLSRYKNTKEIHKQSLKTEIIGYIQGSKNGKLTVWVESPVHNIVVTYSRPLIGRANVTNSGFYVPVGFQFLKLEYGP